MMKRIIQNNLVIFCISSLILLSILGLGFAAVTGIDLSIIGSITSSMQDGIYIYDIQIENSLSNNYVSTSNIDYESNIFHSNIELSPNDSTSKLAFKVSLKNNSNTNYLYENTSPLISDILGGVLESGIEYSNTDIVFKLVDINGNDITTSTRIDANDTLDVYVLFYYKDGVTPSNSNNTLNPIVGINFENNHVLTFNSNGGTPVDDIIVKDGEVLSEIPTTTRSGYTFIGWEDEEGNILSEYFVIVREETFHAIWATEGNNRVNLIFDSMGGDFDMTVRIQRNSRVNTIFDVLPVPHKEGYVFLGWYRYSGASATKLTLNTQIRENSTYQALWMDAHHHPMVDGYYELAHDLDNDDSSAPFVFGDLGIFVEPGKTIETVIKFDVASDHLSEEMNLVQFGTYSEDLTTWDPVRWCYNYIVNSNTLYAHSYNSFHAEDHGNTNYSNPVTYKWVYSYYDTNGDDTIDRVVYYIYDISDGNENLIDTGVVIQNVPTGAFALTDARHEDTFFGRYEFIRVKSYDNTKTLITTRPDNVNWINVASNVAATGSDLTWTPLDNGNPIEIKEKRVIEVRVNFTWDAGFLGLIYGANNNTLFVMGANPESITGINTDALTRGIFAAQVRNDTRIDLAPYREYGHARMTIPNNIRWSSTSVIFIVKYLSPVKIRIYGTDGDGNNILKNGSGTTVNYLDIEPVNYNTMFNYKGNLKLSNVYGTSIRGTYDSIDVRYWDEVND